MSGLRPQKITAGRRRSVILLHTLQFRLLTQGFVQRRGILAEDGCHFEEEIGLVIVAGEQ